MKTLERYLDAYNSVLDPSHVFVEVRQHSPFTVLIDLVVRDVHG